MVFREFKIILKNPSRKDLKLNKALDNISYSVLEN